MLYGHAGLALVQGILCNFFMQTDLLSILILMSEMGSSLSENCNFLSPNFYGLFLCSLYFLLSLVVSTSANDCLEKLASNMLY